MITQKALTEYRSLDIVEKKPYDPYGKAGAARVRELQTIARCLIAARVEADNIMRNRDNPQFPAWKKINKALFRLFLAANYTMPDLARDMQRMHLTPLGGQDTDVAFSAARTEHPRRSNWGMPKPTISQCKNGATINGGLNYRGHHLGRIGYNYYPSMQSAARISTDGTILTALIGYTDGAGRKLTSYTVQAGHGYKWEIDENGVRLVRLADGADYHPNSDDIRSGRTTIVATLRERARTRRKTAAATKRDANLIGAVCKHCEWVSLADSVSADNCRTET